MVQVAAEVWRGGASHDRIVEERSGVRAVPGCAVVGVEKAGFSLKTSIASKGGGVTDVLIFIPEDGFEAIATVMLQGAEKATLRAFAKALLTEKD